MKWAPSVWGQQLAAKLLLYDDIFGRPASPSECGWGLPTGDSPVGTARPHNPYKHDVSHLAVQTVTSPTVKISQKS